MPHFEKHVFICINRREDGHPRGSCAGPCSGPAIGDAQATDAPRGEAIRAAFKDELRSRGLSKVIRANAAGCLDQCEQGPAVVVYPEEVWYTVRSLEDVKVIVEEHLVGGRPVGRLFMAEKPTKPKT